jgi:hypothetical protein
MKINQMTTMPATEPVRYWVGDLCYVLHGAVWNEVCDQTPFDNSTFEFELSDGRKYLLFSTAYGDGTYNDQYGNPYSVDSGTIGAILLDDINDPELERVLENGLGNVYEFPGVLDEFDCAYEDGLIQIGHVQIATGDEFEDDDEEDLEDDEDA